MIRRLLTHRPLGLVLALVVAAGCGDGVGPLRNAPGYYRLVSVNGQPLPYISPPSMGLLYSIWRGDLILRPNGTFASGIGGNVGFGFLAEGTYRVSNGAVALRAEGSTADQVAQASGDSITIVLYGPTDQNLVLTYRRTQLPASTVPSNRYRLSSINGRTQEPLVAYDTTIAGRRRVAYVHFDSVTFSDGVFFRRHRSESAVEYVDGTPGLVSAFEWTTWGAYESGPGWVVLLHYDPPPGVPARDSLSIRVDTLVRRTPLITGPHEERYSRL